MANAFIDQTIVHNFKNGITVEGGLTQTGNQTVTGDLTVTADVVAGTSLTVTSGGATITAGGLNITAGALNHDGTTVGFYAATPVVQAAVPTAMHAAVTQAGTDSGDVAIQAAVQNTGFGFVDAAEFEAIVAMVINNNAVLTEIRTALINLGLMAAA